MIVYL